jgi:aarF domain-containing kinase
MLYIYEWAFAIPCYFVAPYVAKQIRRETDFIHEAQNSERTAAYLANEPALRNTVFVPRVHWEVTSSRVMTADFVAGAHKISDRDKIEEMGFKVKTVMDAMAHAFSAMIFSWGHVHCDPHPGNVLVRPNPANKSKPQIVIIDHGLYVDLSPSFRRQYSELWRALFVLDVDTIDRIAKSWGIANSNLFASATLLRPTTVKKEHKTPEQIEADKTAHKKSAHQAQEELKERLRTMLENEALIPRELVSRLSLLDGMQIG